MGVLDCCLAGGLLESRSCREGKPMVRREMIQIDGGRSDRVGIGSGASAAKEPKSDGDSSASRAWEHSLLLGPGPASSTRKASRKFTSPWKIGKVPALYNGTCRIKVTRIGAKGTLKRRRRRGTEKKSLQLYLNKFQAGTTPGHGSKMP